MLCVEVIFMQGKRWPRRPVVVKSAFRPARRTVIILLFVLAAAVLITGGLVFRSLITELAASSARDVVISAVNGIVKEIMLDEEFDSGSLVNLERDETGGVSAITTNVAAVNTLAAEVLDRAVSQTSNQLLTVDVPLGNLLGSALLLNKGPAIAANIEMLSSSEAGFRSELTSAGINQTRHQLFLELDIQISLLMPWRSISTSVETEILVSETVVVGDVPESYLNWENE